MADKLIDKLGDYSDELLSEVKKDSSTTFVILGTNDNVKDVFLSMGGDISSLTRVFAHAIEADSDMRIIVEGALMAVRMYDYMKKN